MTILFCDNTLWGLLNFRGGIIRHLLAEGHRVVLVAPQDAMSQGIDIPSGARYIPVTLDRTGKNPLEDIRYFRFLKKVYRETRPDYIFHYTIKPNIYGTLAARRCRIPSTAMIAGLGHVYSEGGIGNRIARCLYKYALRYSQHVLVLNQDNYDTLLARRVVCPDKLILMRGGEGVDLQQFVPMPGTDSSKVVFLMIARLLYEKGYAEYTDAGAALPEAEFRLMGPIDTHPSAVSRETVEKDVAAGRIKYVEFASDVRAQIAAADCIVLPSFYGEGLSRVLMESLAMGKPIITTDIPGCRETVEEGVNGFVIEPKNSQALIEACNRICGMSAAEREQMGQKSLEKAREQFDIKHVIRLYEQIVQENTQK